MMTDKDFVRKYAIDLMAEATGGDAAYIEELADQEDIARDDVIDLLRKAKVPRAAPLLSDLDQIFEGEEPRYFVPHDRVVERYREHHHPHADFAERDYGLRSLPSADAVRELKEEILQQKPFGPLLQPYRDGAACLAEQTLFYETDEWRDRATVLRIMDRFTCRMCSRSDQMLHVHHEEHIYSVFSRKFYRNFDVGRLRCLCESCHASFHRSHVRGYSDFAPANPDEGSQRKTRRTASEQLHDSARECRFCFPREAAEGTQQLFGNN